MTLPAMKTPKFVPREMTPEEIQADLQSLRLIAYRIANRGTPPLKNCFEAIMQSHQCQCTCCEHDGWKSE